MMVNKIKEINDMRETQKFLRVTDDIGVVTKSTSTQVNLETLKSEFGHNFNTLLIVNNDAVEISVTLDGRKVAYIASGGGSLQLDWQDGIIFDQLQIDNEDSVTDTVANKIRISVGRTGK